MSDLATCAPRFEPLFFDQYVGYFRWLIRTLAMELGMIRVLWLNFFGRLIKLFTRVRQSVNICDATNGNGCYERRFYLRPGFHVTPATLTRFSSLQQLCKWLEGRSYRQLV